LTVNPDDTVAAVAGAMAEADINSVVVIDGGGTLASWTGRGSFYILIPSGRGASDIDI
jgi:CBS domain-containing protein